MIRSKKKYQVSEEFQDAIREYSQQNDTPLYLIAANVRMAPCILSSIVNRTMLFPKNDPRIQKVAEYLNYSGPCFVVDEQQTTAIAK